MQDDGGNVATIICKKGFLKNVAWQQDLWAWMETPPLKPTQIELPLPPWYILDENAVFSLHLSWVPVGKNNVSQRPKTT